MALLKCDVCGGTLSIDAGGKTATCEFCGAKHSVERMREKVMEIKGTVSIEGEVQVRQTGTREDILQWKKLLDKYMLAYDYKSALSIVNKILEADPSDEDINKLYDALQELQYFDIRNGVLEKYNGNANKIVIPDGVSKIKGGAFELVYCWELIIPDSVEEWNGYCEVYAQKIKFGRNVNVNGKLSCDIAILTGNCDVILPHVAGIKLLVVPESYDGDPLIVKDQCFLEEIRGSEKFKNKVLDYNWFAWLLSEGLESSVVPNVTTPDFVTADGKYYKGIAKSPMIKPFVIGQNTEYIYNIRKLRRRKGVCPYCGSEFEGIFFQKCPKCHIERDY